MAGVAAGGTNRMGGWSRPSGSLDKG
jgi:hypothetical protein